MFSLHVIYYFTSHEYNYNTFTRVLAYISTAAQAESAELEKYPFITQLRELDKCRPIAGVPDLPACLYDIQSPISSKIAVWEVQGLASHPDQQFVQYIVQGLREGFRIDFRYAKYSQKLRGARNNMPTPDPRIVADYLDDELKADRLLVVSQAEASDWAVQCSAI